MTDGSNKDDKADKTAQNLLYKKGASAVSEVLAELRVGEPGLNEGERCSIKSLVAYVAHAKGVSEDVVGAMVAARFGVAGVGALLSRDYETAIQFLVDLNPQTHIQ